MIYSKQQKKYVRQLVALSLDQGQVSAERVSAVLQTLADRPGRSLKPILKLYYRYLRNEVRRSQAIVEHAGDVEDQLLEAIATKLSECYHRPIEVEKRARQDLIAGVRILIGDDVYDSTVAGRLQTLAESIR